MKTPSNGATYGIVLATFGTILFSTKAVLIKMAYAYSVDPVTLLTLRMFFAMPFYVVIASRARKGAVPLQFRDIWQVILFGILGYYIAGLLDFIGLTYISVDLERLLLYTYPMMVLILSVFFFGKPFTQREMLALGITYGGVALVVVNDMGNLGTTTYLVQGVILVLMSALAYAFYLIGSQQIILRLGVSRYTALAMLAATGGSLLHFAASKPIEHLLNLPLAIYGYGLALGVFATVLPSFMTSAGIARIGAAKTAIIGAVGPVATLILAWALLSEPITPVQIGGTVLILYGVSMASKVKGAKEEMVSAKTIASRRG